MRRNKQHIVDSKKGDCFRACLTSILDMPNDESLPNVDDPRWFARWYEILGEMGIHIAFEHKACWREGYWIADVKSLNFEGGKHAIVMNGTKVAHDPSTKKRYRAGTYLGGKDVVTGGWYLEILDWSKLSKYFSSLSAAS